MKIVIKKDPVKGRGVYASQDIAKGEVIEICELIVIKLQDVPPDLEGYVYHYNKSKAAVALGNGSLYNHSKKANCDFYYNPRKSHLYIRAKKAIKKGTEVTINYRYDASTKKRFNIRE